MTRAMVDRIWHGTGFLQAARIVGENHLRQFAWDGLGPGVSCAIAKNSAEYFAVRADTEEAARRAFHRQHGPNADFDYDSEKAQTAYPFLGGVVFELDAALLKQDFELTKIAYSGDWNDEVELRVKGEAGILDVKRYVVGLSFSAENLDWWISEGGVDETMSEALKALSAYAAEMDPHREGSGLHI